MICTGRILRDAPFLVGFYPETGAFRTGKGESMTETAGPERGVSGTDFQRKNIVGILPCDLMGLLIGVF